MTISDTTAEAPIAGATTKARRVCRRRVRNHGPRHSGAAAPAERRRGEKHRRGQAQGCRRQARADGGGRSRHPLPAGRGREGDGRADRRHGRSGSQGARRIDGVSRRAATGPTAFRNSRRIRPTRSGRARKVSNPGCYPTGAVALLRPLVDAGLLPADYPVTINAVSGYSGGGKSMIASFEDGTAPSFELYGLGFEHKHLPETQLYSKLTRRPIFVPSVGNYRQGMLVSVPLHLDTLPGKPGGADLHAALAKRYAGSKYVSVMPLENAAAKSGKLEPEALNETNMLELYVFASDKHRQAVLVARLDNLGKGASGAAVQNMRLMLGLADRLRLARGEASWTRRRCNSTGATRRPMPGRESTSRPADRLPRAASAGRLDPRTRMRRRRRHRGNAGGGVRCRADRWLAGNGRGRVAPSRPRRRDAAVS